MNGFNIPLHITGSFTEKNSTRKLKDSIDDFIELLAFSANGSFKVDRNFGFVFQNFRFENTDMSEQINHKKLYGSSVNENNYAYDLKSAIESYETRLMNVHVMMSFDAIKRKATLEVTGRYEEDFSEKEYKKEIAFYIWN